MFSLPGESIIAAGVGGALNYAGAKSANRANKKMAREQMDFQRESTGEQMAFQERMSNTAYQRSMEDMKKAGLNPILAFNQGGASSPAGASSGGASSTSQNELSGAVSSAMDARRTSAEIANLRKQNENISSQTILNNMLAKQASANTGKTTSDMIRSWMGSGVDAAKDMLPWIMLLMTRGKAGPQSAIMKSIFKR